MLQHPSSIWIFLLSQESNLGPLKIESTALTTRPRLLPSFALWLHSTFFSFFLSGGQFRFVCHLLRHWGGQPWGTGQAALHGKHWCQSGDLGNRNLILTKLWQIFIPVFVYSFFLSIRPLFVPESNNEYRLVIRYCFTKTNSEQLLKMNTNE